MKYYCNVPCNVLADLGDEVLIEVLSHEYTVSDGDAYEPPHIEPLHSKLLVMKKYLTDQKTDFDAKFNAETKRIEKLTKDAEAKANGLVRDAQKKLQDLEKALADRAAKFDGVDQLISMLNGEFYWLVVDDYYSGISVQKFRELVYDSDYSKIKLRGVVFSTVLKSFDGEKIDHKVRVDLDRYSDGSSRTSLPIRGFKTEEEAVIYAKAEILKKIKEKSLCKDDCDTAEKYNMDIPAVAEKRRADAERAAEYKRRELAELQGKIAALSREVT